jgi:exopolysaccharide biosynthesis protein
MRSLGPREAVSLDGAGSSTMASHGRRFTAPRNRIYRAVANGFGIYPR